ncbi:MAG: uroporphyrinogen-III synthase [Polymorphobacter sp.]
MRLLVTRPLPGGEATAARLATLGHASVLAPLMAAEPLAWLPPATPPQAIMLTSAFAARLAAADAWHDLPAYVVGAATAMAARLAGFVDIRDGGGTAQALLDAAAAAGITALLHLAGEDRTLVVIPAGLRVDTRTVYRARLLPLVAVPAVDWVLLYSARTAGHFAAECDRLGVERATIAIAALSAGIITAAGLGWQATLAAPEPSEAALLAAIGATCQKGMSQP